MALWKMKTQKTQWIVLGIIAISLCIIVPTIIYLPKYFTIHYKSYVTTPLRSQNDTIHDKSFDTTPLRSDYEKGLGYQESKGFDNVREQNVIDVWDSAQLELQERLKSASEKKIILIWHAMFNSVRKFGMDSKLCGNCETTYNKTKITDDRTAAVVYHFHAISEDNMPESSTRNPKQLHIYWSKEPPPLVITYGKAFSYENSYAFNATMTYRRDSDFVMSYAQTRDDIHTVRENKNGDYDITKLILFKSKKALALVSNCASTAATRVRLQMIKEVIASGFGLEAFGGCFPQNGIFAGGGRYDMSPEFRRVIRKYKFYFSFENSHHCKDYITEKLFRNAILSSALPVVWGAKKEDYEAVVPPGSFIYVEDYSSISELVKYLDYLDGNDTAYLEYFRWYTTMNPIDLVRYERQKGFCQICRAVHGINVDDVFNPNYNFTHPVRPLFTNGTAPRIIPSLKQWFYGSENNECLKK